jgi:hypothetical protein
VAARKSDAGKDGNGGVPVCVRLCYATDFQTFLLHIRILCVPFSFLLMLFLSRDLFRVSKLFLPHLLPHLVFCAIASFSGHETPGTTEHATCVGTAATGRGKHAAT